MTVTEPVSREKAPRLKAHQRISTAYPLQTVGLNPLVSLAGYPPLQGRKSDAAMCQFGWNRELTLVPFCGWEFFIYPKTLQVFI
jgi:hypothetical protein